ncbi:MAG: GNAT family N-acetyltransferase [Lachnospiraceae bacterium]|nr:GNAT family N-acetyltransferase [Lachnospiraceae bacterium]
MIEIFRITAAQADKLSGLLQPEVYKALKAGKPVTALLALNDGEVAGALGGALNNGIFELSSLYVYPGQRRQGIGKALMDRLSDLLSGEGSEIWAEFIPEHEDNESLCPFLEAIGFRMNMQTFPRYYLSPLEKVSPEEPVPAGNAPGVRSFAEVPEKLLRLTSNSSIKEGYPVPDGGLIADKVDAHVSFCLQSGESISAYIAVERIDRELLRMASIWWSSGTGARDMMELINAVIRELKKRYMPKTKLVLLAVNPVSERLIKYLIKDAKPCSFSYYKTV